MSRENNPDTIFNVENMLVSLVKGLASASEQLHQTFEKEKDKYPYAYHIPKMQLSLQLVLSHSKGKVKGVFKKTKSTDSQELQSNINLDIVAVPRNNVK